MCACVHWGTQVHWPVLGHFDHTYRAAHTWVTHIDVDEFINVRDHAAFPDVKDLLRMHIPVGGLIADRITHPKSHHPYTTQHHTTPP